MSGGVFIVRCMHITGKQAAILNRPAQSRQTGICSFTSQRIAASMAGQDAVSHYPNHLPDWISVHSSQEEQDCGEETFGCADRNPFAVANHAPLL